jgi:DNA-directed RNA polymerase beta' subunit
LEDIYNLFEKPRDTVKWDSIRIKLASPEKIRDWSHGEVTKPETINYRTFKPERGGLFCAKIFGPIKDFECNCGKYKRMKHRGVICDKCGVEVIQSKVRRERLGHIELACPVSHVWFFKGLPSRIGNILNMSLRELERILYFELYVVIDPGDTPLKERELLDEERFQELREEYGPRFKAGMGAEAIRELLAKINPSELAVQLRADMMADKVSMQARKKIVKRLKVVEALTTSGNRPEWMIMEVIPVLPPELRPLVPLDGGRFATSDLNDLYRRVINRNNRLKRLQELKAPDVIVRNEKRMLQEAVDALFDNGRRGRALKGPNNRPLRSLSDMLKGKQGRFRQNLLGKRVDYSGRSVIVVGPELQLSQCGLPKKMALELFKPFIFNKLEEKGLVTTIKNAKKMVEMEVPEVWHILDEVIKDHPVLLNRAPTLHRLGIQAFQPILVEGKAIRIHPLVCTAFNADFDGDQMAVHVPLSLESQLEARLLMMANNNILSPANGSPIAVPTQDIILGCYYLTRMRDAEPGEGKLFASGSEARMAFDAGEVSLQAKIWVRVDGQLLLTSVGRVMFNEALPARFSYYNRIADKNELGRIISSVYRDFGKSECVDTLDAVKDLGFRYASWAGISININDLYIPENKPELIEQARMEVIEVEKQYQDGIITDGERYNKVVDIWTHVTERVADELFRSLEVERYRGDKIMRESGPFNPVYMMSDSGARGSKMQIRQLAGMRGLMAKPSGEIIETPITANFREGLTVLQYFISTHGARKGLADTALKTADSGYLTRRLVDVAQDVIITEVDCGTDEGITVSAIVEGGEVIEPLFDRILGRVVIYDVKDPFTGHVLCKAGDTIDEIKATRIVSAGVEQVKIRSALTCECRYGICRTCYGWDLAQAKEVDMGEAVGVIAAQSIGEPGTQLTMRTFHIGGTAKAIEEDVTAETGISGRIIISSSMKKAENSNGDVVILSRKEGRIIIAQPHIRTTFGGKLAITDDRVNDEPGVRLTISGSKKKTESYFIRSDDLYDDKIKEFEGKLQILSKDGSKIVSGEILVEKMRQQWTVPEKIPYGARLKVVEGQIAQPAIFAKVNGMVRFYHLEGDQLKESDDVLEPMEGGFQVIDRACFMKIFMDEEDTQEVETYYIARGARVLVKVGERVKRDQLIVESTMDDKPDQSSFLLAEWDAFATPLMSEQSGEVLLIDVIDEVTLKEELDVVTGQSRKVIGVYREELKCPEVKCKFREIKRREGKKQYCPIHHTELQPLHPSFTIKGTKIRVALPTGAHLFIENREKIKAGDVVALLLRESQKTKDITGGLPRVVELFEARKPKENAVIAEIDGVINYGTIEKGMQKILIQGASGAQADYDIPRGTHINVQEGDFVRAGEPLMNGSSNPHDILRVLGENELQKYLVNEVQAVYRLQGVVINDKHIEVITRQMLKMIRIDDVGDTHFLFGEQVERWRFKEENDRVMKNKGRPALGSLLLQGITKASLSTESFISAASFQETTRVLTEAAVSGKIDHLRGLKENVVVGRLIPAGTGFPSYQNVAVVAKIDNPETEAPQTEDETSVEDNPGGADTDSEASNEEV